MVQHHHVRLGRLGQSRWLQGHNSVTHFKQSRLSLCSKSNPTNTDKSCHPSSLSKDKNEQFEPLLSSQHSLVGTLARGTSVYFAFTCTRPAALLLCTPPLHKIQNALHGVVTILFSCRALHILSKPFRPELVPVHGTTTAVLLQPRTATYIVQKPKEGFAVPCKQKLNKVRACPKRDSEGSRIKSSNSQDKHEHETKQTRLARGGLVVAFSLHILNLFYENKSCRSSLWWWSCRLHRRPQPMDEKG